MRARSTNTSVLKRLSNSSDEINQSSFRCLEGNDVITAKVSDHHPVIHNNILFWNIMMQGKKRKDRWGNIVGYNNGFGILESNKEYIKRLIKIAYVIAEIIYRNPAIEAITLCEGPVDLTHVNILFLSLMQFSCMNRFIIPTSQTKKFKAFYKPNVSGTLDWGLLMLADNRFKVTETACDFIEKSEAFSKLANRFQLWTLESNNNKKYLALGHFPFGIDEQVTEKSQLSDCANIYCDLINKLLNKYDNDQLTLCADFNLNPFLINQWEDRVLDQIPINNSSLLMAGEKTNLNKIKTVTVDGILLSRVEKQKNYVLRSNLKLHPRLLSEHSLFRQAVVTAVNMLLPYKHRKIQNRSEQPADNIRGSLYAPA